MTAAVDSFYVLSGTQTHVVSRRPNGAPDNGSQDELIERSVWLEDTVERVFEERTQRTIRTGTLLILASVTYDGNESWVIDGDDWQLHHKAGLDTGLRVIHLRRDDKVATGMESQHRF